MLTCKTVALLGIEVRANVFVFLAHFAVRSFELLGRHTRCACEHLQRFEQATKLFEIGVNMFRYLVHFAVRSFELLGRNTTCAYERLKRFVASAKIA